MRLKLTAAILTFAFVQPTIGGAAMFCEHLGDPSQLPKKYAKKAPFHTDENSGWIVGSDQLKANFEVTEEVSILWKEIHSEFEARGVTLKVLAPPPRPLFAPEEVIAHKYDASKARSDYSKYIEGLNLAGIDAPDLTRALDDKIADEFYFSRDTHWTPKGAAFSVALLGEETPEAFLSRISFADEYIEKGSLSTVVEKTCGARPLPETVPSPDYETSSTGLGLLDEDTGKAIALVGTSFSNRYQDDVYQVAGALSHSLGETVENFSVTGGGMAGAMEAFVNGGHLQSGRYHTVIWETPYTMPLTDLSGLRQIHGALLGQEVAQAIYNGTLNDKWTNVHQEFLARDFAAVLIETPNTKTGKLDIEFFNAAGDKIRAKLVKSNRVNQSDRSDLWAFSLAGLPIDDVSRIKLRLRDNSSDASILLIK